MYKRLGLFFLTCLLFSYEGANAKTIVKVSGYTFPPYVNIADNGGVTADFIELLNHQQNDFEFVFKKTSPNRRYREITEKKADLILFEMPGWGWEKYAEHISSSKIFFIGGEVYIAKPKEGRTQKYFSTIGSKSIAGVFGYHYGFAGFSKDPEWLQENFEISLSHNPENIIRLVANGRVEIGVVTQSFLSDYLQKKPGEKSKLMISDRKDQGYEMRAIIGNHSPITVETFNQLIDNIFSSGALQAFAKRKGLEAHLP